MHNLVMIKTTLGTPNPCQSLDAIDNGAYWAILYCDFPPDVVRGLTASEILDKARVELVHDVKGVLVSETTVRWRSYPGLDITIDSYLKAPAEKGTVRARLYVVGERLYRIETYVYGENWQNRMNTMEPFLDSFYILDAE